MSRPVIHGGAPRSQFDLAPLFPASWAVLSATLTRSGDVVTIAIGARPLEAVSGELFWIPPEYRPPTPITGRLKRGNTSDYYADFVLSTSGPLTSYAVSTSASWCYWSDTWITTAPVPS